jgi:hypothetical protein
MLIEFRVENHRSLRDEVVLTLEAGRVGESSDPRPRSAAAHSEKLLPVAVIYGANASGKSNVMSALGFMRQAVLLSHRRWDPNGGVPRTSFAWGESRDRPSMFEVSFLADATRYTYGFVVDDASVQEEWLFAWPNNRKQIWFEREGGQFSIGGHLRGTNEPLKEVTRQNALFLSVAAQHGHRQLLPIYSWFRAISPVNIPGFGYPMFRHDYVADVFFPSEDDQAMLLPREEPKDNLLARLRQLLRATDLGIVDVKRVDTEHEYRGRAVKRRRVLLQHQEGDDQSWLDLEEESEGTKTVFRMAPAVFRTLDTGGLLLVDELESSLHPLLGLAIVQMFNSPKANPRNAQVVFTTHDTNLLGTTLGDPPLRRDQVWFTEKDKEGASRLYPLTDFKPRKSENLERGYLQGRYGSIPFLGDITWITE